ncbi:receptor-interacting serine/threonine-protein kinase 1-like [Ptychodera flava]|uniref:receptor-interacting serine/threonine-protein kinase 1-like n=1 Tax=Ptychodera flava TaxID=63121 RepID=UPI00396A3D81
MSHSTLTKQNSFTVIPAKDIEEFEIIGSGAFGIVHKAHHKNWGDVVIKRMFKNPSLSERESKDLKSEAEIMTKAHFKHVTLLYGVIMEPGNYSLVLELMEHGSLKEFQSKFDNPWASRKEMIYQIILGMNYLHTEMKIVHRDLKVDNVLVGSGYDVKVSDFGLSKWKKLSKKYTKHKRTLPSGYNAAGTISHIAPEKLNDLNLKPSYQCDVYSFAITVWEIITNKVPYEEAENSTLVSISVQRDQRPDESLIPKDCPDFLVTMMKDCWHGDPEKRPTFSDLKEKIEERIKENEGHKDELCEAHINLKKQEKYNTPTDSGNVVSQPAEEESENSIGELTGQMARSTLESQNEGEPQSLVSLASVVLQDADQSTEHPAITKTPPNQSRGSNTVVKEVDQGCTQIDTGNRRESSLQSSGTAFPHTETGSPGSHPHGPIHTESATSKGSNGGTPEGQHQQVPPQAGFYAPGMMGPFYMPNPAAWMQPQQMMPGMQPPTGTTTIYKTGPSGSTVVNIAGATQGVQVGDRNVMYVQSSGRSTSAKTKPSGNEARRKIKVTTSQSPVTLEDLDNISGHVGHQFRPLGRKCGFSDGELDGFAHDYSTLKEQNYQMLRTWKGDAGKTATRDKLARLLCEVKLYDAASRLPFD